MQIDFYILDEKNLSQALQFVCKLVEKFYLDKGQVYLHTESREAAEKLDNLLWTFSDTSFLPHAIYDIDETSPPAIQIGHGNTPIAQHDKLINLCPTVPVFYQQFRHVIEVVLNEPVWQQLARERYKHYRNDGQVITTHKLNNVSHT